MAQILFKKVKGEDQDYLIIFETFRLNKPLLVLADDQVDRLIDEWKKKK